MAKPIKETPILHGKDAKKFIEQHNKQKDSIAVQQEKQKILDIYKMFQPAEKFNKHITA